MLENAEFKQLVVDVLAKEYLRASLGEAGPKDSRALLAEFEASLAGKGSNENVEEAREKALFVRVFEFFVERQRRLDTAGQLQ